MRVNRFRRKLIQPMNPGGGADPGPMQPRPAQPAQQPAPRPAVPGVGAAGSAAPGPVGTPAAPSVPSAQPVARPAGVAPAGSQVAPPPISAPAPAAPPKVLSLDDMLSEVHRRGGSDLHLTVGVPPMMRLHGKLMPLDYPMLKPGDTHDLCYSIMTDDKRKVFEQSQECDFSYSIPGVSRFRVNVYFQRHSVGAAIRLISVNIRSFEELGLPAIVGELVKKPRGFILVTGPTGSGKSSTLAAMIDVINSSRSEHIMTVEDPIEFLHNHKKCVVNQREVGSDTQSFAQALKHVLRQDPDVILVGEMRDLETIHAALTAAETGHLVFATLHTQDAPQTIDRIIDVFPPHQQQQVRVQLAGTLQGILCQQLLATTDGAGRAVAVEVLVPNSAVRNLIREAKTHQIYSVMQTGSKFGMQTMDSALADLFQRGKITRETALTKAGDPESLKALIGGGW